MLWAVELACVLTIVTEMRSDLKYAKLMSSFATFLGNAIINFFNKVHWFKSPRTLGGPRYNTSVVCGKVCLQILLFIRSSGGTMIQ